MEGWLAFARGPLFRFALLIMLLGLGRHLLVTIFNAWRAVRRAGDPRIPYGAIAMTTIRWLFPFKNLNNRLWYSITSVLFHVGLILTPLFLAAHILLWKRGLGMHWPGLPPLLADGLTVLTIIAGVMLLIGRTGNRESRALSRLQDFVLPALLLVPFLTGFLAVHPALSPIPYGTAMLIHVLSGDLILILIPFSKLAHMVLLPTTQIVSELGWRFPADQGVNVGIALHKETEPV
jgi:nitrate reductase gamma subunit